MLSQRYSVGANGVHLRSASASAPKAAQRSARVEANFTSAVAAPTSVMATGGLAYSKFFTGIAPEGEESLLPYFRDMYHHDSIAGATVDMIGTFPFSNWTLVGLEKSDMETYNDNMARLNLRAMMPEISLSYLVDGAFIGSLVYDPGTKSFQDVLIHDRMSCQISARPFFSLDPVITVNSTAQLQQFMQHRSPYVSAVMSTYPRGFIDAFSAGAVVLDPFTTMFIPRKTTHDSQTTSYLRRLLPMYFLEKTLYRGTVVEATRRMRATSHVQVGTDTWEPTPSEMQMVLGEFQLAEADPLGAWVVTRQGVQVQDIRTAGDMWKWTDLIDTLVPYKLRALGISEAFLSGDANYSCLAGNTLIPTRDGLRRIDSFGEGRDRKKTFKVNAVMDSRYGPQRASSWQYNGFQKTLRITTDTGNCLQATGNHPLLVLNAETGATDWKRTDKIQLGDILCVSRNRVVRERPLKLNVPRPAARTPLPHDPNKINKRGDKRGCTLGSKLAEPFQPGEMPKVPTHMTPELAYWLALFISEGSTRGTDAYCTEPNKTRGLAFANTDKRLTQRFAALAEHLFGVQAKAITTKTRLELELERFGTGFNPTKDFHYTYISNRRLVDWVEAIGVYVTPGRVDDKTPSYQKTVPWSILEADHASQTAFLASYAECDGTIRSRTSWMSVSSMIIDGILAILNSHGYQPTVWRNAEGSKTRVTLSVEDSEDFWKEGSKYLSLKAWKPTKRKHSKLDGVPATYWTNLVAARKIKFDRHGQYFLTDDHSVICWSKNPNSVSATTDAKPWGFNLSELKRFNYQYFDEGRYDNFLGFLKQLSPAAHAKLLQAMKHRYRYTPVTRIEGAGSEHVYDISMPAGKEPAFVANGLVVHNTAETAMSVFTENMAAYREFLTHRIFRDKLFPLIAVANDMYVDTTKAAKERTLTAVLRNMSNHRNLRIPEIRWHKNLENHDPSVMEALNSLGDKGIPVPLKMWAAAANVDMGMLLGNLEEDNAIREAIERITGKKPQDQGGLHEGGDESGDFGDYEGASMRDRLRATAARAPIRSGTTTMGSRRVGLLDRDYGNSADAYDAVLSKSGNKVHAALNGRARQQRQNDHILKAMRALRDPHHRKQVRDRIASKNGGVFPNIMPELRGRL